MEQRTPAEVVRLCKDESIEIVDVRFSDLPGMTQHFSVPTHELTEDKFTRASVSTARRSGGSSRSKSRT